ncbi:MAG: cell division protein FtsZ [Eubacteriales bacterium]|nr:cell division protein FtsZ [Eubacteriales bacterium]
MSYELETAVELKTTKQVEDVFGDPPVVNIKVVGVGGGGCNSVNRMLEDGVNLPGVEFIAINTDKNALSANLAPQKLCIGQKTTHGFGAGTRPEVGQKAAEESADEIRAAIEGADLLFITAGMGGGTGTGAAPVVAMIAKEMGILTVAVVTKPFNFEGNHRMLNAEIGIENLSKFVDAYVVVPNQKLVEHSSIKTSFLDAFKMADEALRQAVIGLSEGIVNPILVNVDFADVKVVLGDAGLAHMGVGRAQGQNRVLEAIKQAVASPLIETSISGATRMIMCIKGDKSLPLAEVSSYVTMAHNLVHENCNIKWSVDVNDKYGDTVEVLIIASGFAPNQQKAREEISNMKEMPQPQMGTNPEPVAETKPNGKPKFFEFFKNFKK